MIEAVCSLSYKANKIKKKCNAKLTAFGCDEVMKNVDKLASSITANGFLWSKPLI